MYQKPSTPRIKTSKRSGAENSAGRRMSVKPHVGFLEFYGLPVVTPGIVLVTTEEQLVQVLPCSVTPLQTTL